MADNSAHGKGAYYFPEGHKHHRRGTGYHDPDDPDCGGDTVFDSLDGSEIIDKHLQQEPSTRICKHDEGLPDVTEFMGETHMEKRRMHKGLPRTTRKIRYPELFKNSRYGVDLVRMMFEAQRPPEWSLAAMEEVIPYSGDDRLRDGKWPEGRNPKYVVAMHPAFQRPCLFELVQNPKHGPCYRAISIKQEEPKEGHLPGDVSEERWGHLRGFLGDYAGWFNRQDYEKIRYYGDRHVGLDVQNQRLSEGDDHAEKEADAFHSDFLDDFHDYFFRAVQQAANNGQKQWCHVTPAEELVRQNNEKRLYQEKHQGYTIRTKRGSKFETILRRERELEAIAESNDQASEQTRKERDKMVELQRRARQSQLAKQATTRNKTL